jgi:hypothetical protein
LPTASTSRVKGKSPEERETTSQDAVFREFALAHPQHPWKGWQEHYRTHKVRSYRPTSYAVESLTTFYGDRPRSSTWWRRLAVEKRLNELFYSEMCMIFIVNDLESSGIVRHPHTNTLLSRPRYGDVVDSVLCFAFCLFIANAIHAVVVSFNVCCKARVLVAGGPHGFVVI